MASEVPRLCTKSSLPEYARFSTLSRLSPRNGGRRCCSDPHFTHAGGQDDGSYTNSLKTFVQNEAKWFDYTKGPRPKFKNLNV